MVDPIRIRHLNDAPVRPHAEYVLYWAQINRRVDSNHALAHAAEWANALGLPLLMFEGMTTTRPRFDRFILDGIAENARRAAKLGIGYEGPDESTGKLYRLASKAACLVTDDFPGYMASTHNARVPAKIGIPYTVVDASTIVPLAAIPEQQYAAYSIRPKVNRLLPEYLHSVDMPKLKHRFPRQGGGPVREYPEAVGVGGRREAERRLRAFLGGSDPHSHLSAHIHFGHISTLEIALQVEERPEFLEQLIVRRELAFNFARYGPNPHTLNALPEWARKTLAQHDPDKREFLYTFEQFEQAATHDPIWNATQRELLRDGVIQSYQRMYWGKKIIEWSPTHQDALDTMIALHDAYALDGRDPNTYTNILWCFGLHDRPWQERPIFGMIRYMSAEGMRRKTDVDGYIRSTL